MSVFKVVLNNVSAGGLQGNLDVIANFTGTTGTPPGGLPIGSTGYTGTSLATSITTSLQRTIYVMGPRKINRELKDGQTFTDCNYWKRFATQALGGLAANYVPAGPTGSLSMPNDTCFIQVLSDDGTFWSDDQRENAFPVSRSYQVANADTSTGTNAYLVANSTYWGATTGNNQGFTATGQTGAQSNCWNYLLQYGAPATFVEVYNHGNSSVILGLNGTYTTAPQATMTVPSAQTWVFNQADCQISAITLYGTGGSGGGYNQVDVVAGITSYPLS